MLRARRRCRQPPGGFPTRRHRLPHRLPRRLPRPGVVADQPPGRGLATASALAEAAGPGLAVDCPVAAGLAVAPRARSAGTGSADPLMYSDQGMFQAVQPLPLTSLTSVPFTVITSPMWVIPNSHAAFP